MSDQIGLALDREKDQLLVPDWSSAPVAEESLSPASRKAIEERTNAQADGVLAPPSSASAPPVDVVNAPLPGSPSQVLPAEKPAVVAETHEHGEPAGPQSTAGSEAEEGDGSKVEAVLASVDKMPAQGAAAPEAPGGAAPATPQTANSQTANSQTANSQTANSQTANVTAPAPAPAVETQAQPAPTQASPATAAHTATPVQAGAHTDVQAAAQGGPATAQKGGAPTGSDPWSRFVYAIGQNESGWKHGEMKNGEEVIGAGTTGTSGMDASYGRFQTTAASAVDVLRKNPEAAKQFGFDKAELGVLNGRMNSVQTWWDLIVKGKVGGGKEYGFTTADVALAQEPDPEPFKAKWGAKWTQSTSMAVGDLDRMLATVQFKAVIEHYAPTKKKIKDKKERARIAQKIFTENPALFARLGGMQAKDLTGFLKTNMMLENLAGFQMKAAGGESGHLFHAINQNAGLDFGMSELKSVRDGVEARAQHFGVKIKNEEHLYMLCARAHNKGMSTLSLTNFQDPNSLLSDDYVKEMLVGYHSGPSKSQAAAMNGGGLTAPVASTSTAQPHTTTAKAPTHAVPAAHVATQPGAKPATKPAATASAASFELFKKEAMSLSARVFANQMTSVQALAEFASFAQSHGGIASTMASGVSALLKQMLPVTPAAAATTQNHPAPATATVGPGQAAVASHATIPAASAGFHDGGKNKALGEGDEAFNASGQVVAVFPATPQGVVEAALYELHRGDKRSMAEIMADETRAKTERGTKAAVEGKESFVGKDGKNHSQGTNDDAAGHQVVGHLPDKYDKKGQKVSDGGELGPIEAYVHAVDQKPGIPWCGSFATFVYKRAGINVKSLAYSLDVPNVLAQSEANGHQGSYYHMTGTEGSAKIDKSKAYGGEFEAGQHAQKGVKGKTGQNYAAAKPKTGLDFDVRPGDVFWQQHSAKSGHVGIIIGVEKKETEVTCVTVEGNASDQVISRVHKIEIGKDGKVTAGFKGWGRPGELGGAPAPLAAAGDDKWIDAIAAQGTHDIHDR